MNTDIRRFTRRAGLLGLLLISIVSLPACAIDEPLDDADTFRSQSSVLACSDDQPPQPGTLAPSVAAVFDQVWPAFVQTQPQFATATPGQVAMLRDGLALTVEAIDADIRARAPANGCVVVCATDGRTPQQVAADGDVCFEHTQSSPQIEAMIQQSVINPWGIWQDLCNTLRNVVYLLEQQRAAVNHMMVNCSTCTTAQIDALAKLEAALYSAMREIARKAHSLGCTPPAGWSGWAP